MAGRQFEDERLVQGLDEAHVGDGGVELFPGLEGGGDEAAPGQQGDVVALAYGFALADGQRVKAGLDGRAGAFTARVAHGGGACVQKAGAEHLAAFVFIGRGHDDQVGDAGQVAVVEAAGMGGAVGADQPGAVEGEQHVEVLQGDVMDELVVAALQEGRVDGDHGLEAFAGLPRREGDGMLFGDGDVKVTFGVLLGELHQPGAFAHRRGDAQQPGVLRGHVAQPVAEHFGVGRVRGGSGLGQAFGFGVEGGHAVVGERVLFGGRVALALLGDDVQEPWALDVLEVLQGGDQHVHVVAVDGADVVEAQLLEQGARHDHALDVLLGAPCQFPDGRHLAQHLLAFLAHRRIQAAGEDF